MAILMFFNLPHIARAAEVVGETPGLWKRLTSGLSNTVVNVVTAVEKTSHAVAMGTQAVNTTATRVDDVIDTAGRETIYLLQQVRELFPWMAKNIVAIGMLLFVLFAVGNLLKIVSKSRSNNRRTNANTQVQLERLRLNHERQVKKDEQEYANEQLRIKAKLLAKMLKKRGGTTNNNGNFPALLQGTNRAFSRLSFQNSPANQLLLTGE